MCNSQPDNLNLEQKIVLNNFEISSNVVGDSTDENNFPHKLLLTNTQVSQLRKPFANGSSINIKLSETQSHKILLSGGFLGRPLGLLLKTNLSLIGSLLKPLAKSVLLRLRLWTAASATDAPIHKKMFGSGMTTIIIFNKEMNEIMKIIESLEESGLLIKGISKTIKNVGLLGNMLADKGVMKFGDGTTIAGQDF